MLKFVAERWEFVKDEKDGVNKMLNEKFGFLYANQVEIYHIRPLENQLSYCSVLRPSGKFTFTFTGLTDSVTAMCDCYV